MPNAHLCKQTIELIQIDAVVCGVEPQPLHKREQCEGVSHGRPLLRRRRMSGWHINDCQECVQNRKQRASECSKASGALVVHQTTLVIAHVLLQWPLLAFR